MFVGVRHDAPNVGRESRLAPPIARRVFGRIGLAGACGLESRARGGGVEFWIVSFRQMEVAAGPSSTRVLIDEST